MGCRDQAMFSGRQVDADCLRTCDCSSAYVCSTSKTVAQKFEPGLSSRFVQPWTNFKAVVSQAAINLCHERAYWDYGLGCANLSSCLLCRSDAARDNRGAGGEA